MGMGCFSWFESQNHKPFLRHLEPDSHSWKNILVLPDGFWVSFALGLVASMGLHVYINSPDRQKLCDFFMISHFCTSSFKRKLILLLFKVPPELKQAF